MGIGFKRGGMVSYVNVNVSAQEGGTVSGGGRYMKGRSVTVAASVPAGKYFTGWYNGSTRVSTDNPYTFTPTSNVSLAAQTEYYTVTCTDGTVTRNSNGSWTVKANGKPDGYTFAGFTKSGSVVSTSSPYTFTPTSNTALVATWNKTAWADLNFQELTTNYKDYMTVDSSKDPLIYFYLKCQKTNGTFEYVSDNGYLAGQNGLTRLVNCSLGTIGMKSDGYYSGTGRTSPLRFKLTLNPGYAKIYIAFIVGANRIS